MEMINLKDILFDSSMNVREKLDADTIERYMECFDQLPPVVVFREDGAFLYTLADGFHRCEAARILERLEVKAEVKQGNLQDAMEYAAKANLQHGKPLTRTERRKAVERMLKLYPERSDSWIAEDMGVSDKTVRKYRENLESNSEIPSCSSFVTKDGREFPREIQQETEIPQQTMDFIPMKSEAPKEADATTIVSGKTQETDSLSKIFAEEFWKSRDNYQDMFQEFEQYKDMYISIKTTKETGGKEINGKMVSLIKYADERGPTLVLEPLEGGTVDILYKDIYCYNEMITICSSKFCPLDEIREYIGKKVELCTGFSDSSIAVGVVRHGKILEVFDYDNDEIMLDFETVDKVRLHIPSGTAKGTAKKMPTEGIVEIRIAEVADTSATDTPEVMATSATWRDNASPIVDIDIGKYHPLLDFFRQKGWNYDCVPPEILTYIAVTFDIGIALDSLKDTLKSANFSEQRDFDSVLNIDYLDTHTLRIHSPFSSHTATMMDHPVIQALDEKVKKSGWKWNLSQIRQFDYKVDIIRGGFNDINDCMKWAEEYGFSILEVPHLETEAESVLLLR